MAENDTTTSQPVTTQTETTRAEATVEPRTTTATVAGASNETGTGSTDNTVKETIEVSEKPSSSTARKPNQSDQERIAEIDQILSNGVLSVDQAAALREEQKNLKKAAEGADGETNRLPPKAPKKDDDKDNKFAEQDIIKYMYNEWLLKFGCWCGEKIENIAGTAYLKLQDHVAEGYERGLVEAEKIKATKAYQARKSIADMRASTSERLKKRESEKLATVQKLAQAISDGKMASESATDLLALANYMNVKPENVGSNQEIQNIVQTSLKHKQLQEGFYQSLGISERDIAENPQIISEKMEQLKKDKNNPQLYEEAKARQKEVVESQKRLCELGARFAQRESRKVLFDSNVDQTSLLLAEAKILDTIAKKGKAYDGKSLAEVFKGQTEQYRYDLQQLTGTERELYIEGKNKKTVFSSSGAAPTEINVMGSIETYNKLAHKAAGVSISNITHHRFQEMEEITSNPQKPFPNVALEKMDGFIKEGQRGRTQPSDERLQQAEQDAQRNSEQIHTSPERVATSAERTPDNLGEESEVNRAHTQRTNEWQADFSRKETSLDARINAHQERGNYIVMRKNQIQALRQQELVAEGVKNNFQGWRIVGKGNEM